MVSIDLHGRTALITGASGGIGRAIAEAYAAAGANLVLHGPHHCSEADDVVRACRARGVRASFVSSDFFLPPQQCVEQLFGGAMEAEPDIDILVNNAGGCLYSAPFEQVTYEQFEKQFRLNFVAPYFLAQRFVQHWLAHGTKGRILQVGSINGRLAECNSSAYDASKGAVEMMVKSLAAELAGQGIRVNGMAPGLVLSRITSWIKDRPEDAAWMKLHTPNHQIPGPESCAGAALFLVSDAAEHIHGHMLLVDGGMSAWQQPPRPKDK